MELIHRPAARGLVQAVDVLGDHRLAFALLFQGRQPQMGGVGLGPVNDELFAVEVKEFGGVLHKEGVGKHGLRRIAEGLVVQTVHAAEIRDAALGGNTGAAEKHQAAAFLDQTFQFRYHCLAPFGFLGV